MGTCRVVTVTSPKLEKSSLPIGCESVEVSAAEPAWQISGLPSPTPLSWCSRFSGEILGLSMCCFQLLRQGAPGGFGGSSDNEGSGRAHGPGLACRGLENCPSSPKSPCSSQDPLPQLVSCRNRSSHRGNCRLLKSPLDSKDSVGRLQVRIEHFLIDKEVLGLWSFRDPFVLRVTASGSVVTLVWDFPASQWWHSL